MITRIPECRCLNCGYKMDSAGGANTEAAAEPGCICLCIACGAVMVFDDDLTLRGMTLEEMDELTNDAETMQFLAGQVRAIHMLPKMN